MFEPNDTGQLTAEPRKSRRDAPGDGYMDRMDADQAAWARKNLDKKGIEVGGQSTSLPDMDSAEGNAIHRMLMGHYTHELDRQGDAREQMAMDEAMYDHEQWTAEEIAILEARGQTPLVFNLIHTTVNWILGTQRRAKMDYKILPRTKHGLVSAESKTELFRHLRDVNHSEFEWSLAFRDAVRAGVGWIEGGQGAPEDGARVYERHESWRNLLWDTTSIRYDILDSRYMFRQKWMDLDMTCALFPKRKGLLQHSAMHSGQGLYLADTLGDEAMDSQEMEYFNSLATTAIGRNDFGSERRRVRMIEGWFRRMELNALMIRGGQFNGELYDEWSAGQFNELASGRATLIGRPRETVHVAIMTEKSLVDLRKSPYRHNRFPFTPVWGYRRASDNMPYGLIRGIRDIQRDLNKRASKALHHLSTTRVFVEEGAVDDLEELRDEAGRPDAMIVYKAGKQPPTVTTEQAVAAAHMELMQMDASMIQQVGGVTNENLGRDTNAQSGKAIIAKQEQGSLATSTFFDNYALSRALHGELQLINIEQFYTDEDEFRITDKKNKPKWIPINIAGDPSTAIGEFKSDFIITEEDWRATTRQANAEQLLALAQNLGPTAPDFVMAILPIIVEEMDLPHAAELSKQIRQITGQPDPDEDPNNPSPETLALQEAKAAEAAIQEAAMQAEMDAMTAQTDLTKAQADKIRSDISKAMTEQLRGNIGASREAFEAALAIAGAPAVAAAADQMLMQAMMAAENMAMGAQPQPEAMPVAPEPMGMAEQMPPEAQQMVPPEAQLPPEGAMQ